MIDDDATQFSYFKDNELTQLAEINRLDNIDETEKALEEGTLFLNKYKILKVIGEGSFSLIYLLEAKDASKKLLVAKEFFPKGFVTRNKNNEVILKTSLTNKEIENYHFMKDIFIGEAQNLVRISSRTHPNVLSFFALEEDVNNTMYLITDYEEGITLKDYIRQRKKEYKGKLNNQEVQDLLLGLLSGLEHIHNVKIYHQDIKLENILIRHDNTPLLLDFGASVILYDEKRKKYFNATTPRYAAPEQIELSQPPEIDQRSDIYALGVLAYKLITDTFPPKASERLKALEEQHKEPYIPLEIQKTYGYETILLKAIDKALALEPMDRFQNTTEFKSALLMKESNFSGVIIGKVLLGLLLPILAFVLFLLWPVSQGTAKLNLQEKTYFVYSDGVKVPISEEKTILLPTGVHELTFIKDGYVPYEVNTTIEANKITNITGELIPSIHNIQLSSNIDNASFIVNGEVIKGNILAGKYNETYNIQTIALNYHREVLETDYVKLYHKKFRFYQKLKYQKQKQKVLLEIKKDIEVGKTLIKVNGKLVKNNTFEAEDSKKYRIQIENPYFQPIDITRSYDELKQSTTQKFILKRGEGQVMIRELVPNSTIEVYNDKLKVNAKIKYKKNSYIIKLQAHPRVVFKFFKKGYDTTKSDIFSLKNKGNLVKKYRLVKKIQISIDKHHNILKKIQKVRKIKDNKQASMQGKIKKTFDKLKPNIGVGKEKSKSMINKKVKTKQKSVTTKKVEKKIELVKKKKKIVQKKNTKRKQKVQKNKSIKKYESKRKSAKKKRKNVKSEHRKKVRQKQKPSNSHLWYCVASGNGPGVWSAKLSSRQKAHSMALRNCRKKIRRGCQVSSCYLWSQ